MSQKNDPRPPGEVTTITDEREPYEAPRLEWEALFEVLALACGKIQPDTHDCMTMNRSS